MDLEELKQSEVNQTEEDQSCVISLMAESVKKRDQICGYQRLEVGREG